MSVKTKLQSAARSTLQTFDKGLVWMQKHPVAAERTVLVLFTIFATRTAMKKFSPAKMPKLDALNKLDAYTSNVVNGYETPSGGRIEILRTVTPGPFDDVNDAAYVAHLEVRDLDIEEMNQGFVLGMIFNVKDHFGVKNTPLAVMPYERFMDHVKDGFPRHETAEALLSENGGKSNFTPIMDKYFGTKS